MGWTITRSIPSDRAIYTSTVCIEALLEHPCTTKEEIAALTLDFKAAIPAEIYQPNMEWMEQNLKVFAMETKDNPPWMKRIYCNMSRAVSLRDNTRCINCCNNFTYSVVGAWNHARCMVVLERVDDGMRIEVMDAGTMMDKYADDIRWIMDQSIIHHNEEREEMAE